MATIEGDRVEFLTFDDLPTKRYPDAEEFLARTENVSFPDFAWYIRGTARIMVNWHGHN